MTEYTQRLKNLISSELEELAQLLEQEKPSAVRKVRKFIEYLDGTRVGINHLSNPKDAFAEYFQQ